jgi:hypothetical protein
LQLSRAKSCAGVTAKVLISFFLKQAKEICDSSYVEDATLNQGDNFPWNKTLILLLKAKQFIE